MTQGLGILEFSPILALGILEFLGFKLSWLSLPGGGWLSPALVGFLLLQAQRTARVRIPWNSRIP
ncbi:MAG: hypothetical protein SPE49_06115 [Campylobacter sp.]|uniref:hypothetical protein n=1 Tax=Campylobacter sp. TaxID=205 RepID=UPI002A3F88BF|nr:hypothetical protein [Campylobacter sp.]MDD6925526.1 hypothetical protein [Campylobacteraceae bacterium]MDY5115525.1 hypothetical protein [Campylobacter sp.]